MANFPPRDYFSPGDWNVNCSMCGRKIKASSAVQNWQGQWRCQQHNEPRQPQDFVRAVPDIQTPPFVQIRNDSFVSISECITIESWGDTTPLDLLQLAIATEDGIPLSTE